MTNGSEEEITATPVEGGQGPRSYTAAWVLIALGAILLASNLFDLSGGIFLIVLGAAFLMGFFSNRSYGLLVPAMILIGLGVGVTVSDLRIFYLDRNWIPLFLGLGFVAIYLTDQITWKQSTTWPLWPGGILVVIALFGIAIETGFFTDIWWEMTEFVGTWWPLALIIWGVLLLRKREKVSEPAGTESPTHEE